VRRQLLLAATLLGCGSADDAPPASMARPGAVERTAARIVVGEDGPWIDVVVEGGDEEAREACESLVNAEVRTAGRARIERPCAAAALPAVARGASGSHVLVDDRALDATDALLAGRAARDATVTLSTRFADRAACEDARRMLAEIASRDHVGGSESARRFLHDQLERAQREETERCAAAVDAVAACADNRCRIERDHQRRNCASARAEVSSLKKRIAAPEPDSPAVTPGECRAE
jgi:hypothetical protein